jgi:ABC-2 type transport system ATP-binding protein
MVEEADFREYALVVTELVKDYPRPGKGMISFFLPTWRHDSIRALDGISFAVPRGSIFGLLGTNGAGKTTLIKIVYNLIMPSSGSAEVFGTDPMHHARQIRGRMGMINSEERSFYWRISGRRNLEFFASLQGMDSDSAAGRIDELGSLLDITPYLDVPFSDYSTGMRQKIAVARALLHDPELLLMDEPTRSLSPEAAYPIQDFFVEELVRDRGKTVLVATQDMNEAERMCDDVAILHRGRFLYLGPLSELVQRGRRELGNEAGLADIFVDLVGKGGDA